MQNSAIVLVVNETHFYKDVSNDPYWTHFLCTELVNATLFPSGHPCNDQLDAEKILHEAGYSFRSVLVSAYMVRHEP